VKVPKLSAEINKLAERPETQTKAASASMRQPFAGKALRSGMPQ
jgi:hypothetical protein